MKWLVISLAVVLFALAELASAQTEEAALEESGSSLITMDFEDAEIRDVVRVIAMASGMNMVIGEDVQAKVTVSLKEVPWRKALDVILRTYNFAYKEEENRVIPIHRIIIPIAENLKGEISDDLLQDYLADLRDIYTK